MAIAHTRNADGRRQDLPEHLHAVAEATSHFAESLGAAEAGRLLGLWHDVGKWHPRFQAYLERSERDPDHREYVDHKAAGAELARRHLGWPLAMLIQGHHGGLRDPTGFQAWLNERLATGEPETSLAMAAGALPGLEPASPPALPSWVEEARSELEVELFLRLMYSALVDADSLDTEHHEFPDRTTARGAIMRPEDLWRRLESSQAQLLAGAPPGLVSDNRRTVYQACLAASELAPGIFRLTVPTGGGKTRSGMAFALRHAMRHGLKRVIVAVPYLTITDQTAAEYREMFDPENLGGAVLEHHSQADDGDEDSFDPDSVWMRLAAENWDAPIIVTTTVQLFESLFANRRGANRKVHRLARSVIILDEAQSLPAGLLAPILDALGGLTTKFGTTVVLSTATQPAFDIIPEFSKLQAREIIPDATPIFKALKRVRYDWSLDRPRSWDEVAAIMRAESKVLVILNTKRDVHALLTLLDDREALHLSTALCGAHRRDVLVEVKRRLSGGERCHLVSTQVVEAGVDIDFPLVLRALGPLDSIIQAGGRCNREGLIAEGRVVVFEPSDGGLPPGIYRTATDKTRALLSNGPIDPDDPATSRDYFRTLLVAPFTNTDREGIQPMRARLGFPEVARAFRMIKEPTASVVVPYERSGGGSAAASVKRMRARNGPARLLWRQIQPYLVSMRAAVAERYRAEGLITDVVPGLGEWHGRYDPVLGLIEGVGPEFLVG